MEWGSEQKRNLPPRGRIQPRNANTLASNTSRFSSFDRDASSITKQVHRCHSRILCAGNRLSALYFWPQSRYLQYLTEYVWIWRIFKAKNRPVTLNWRMNTISSRVKSKRTETNLGAEREHFDKRQVNTRCLTEVMLVVVVVVMFHFGSQNRSVILVWLYLRPHRVLAYLTIWSISLTISKLHCILRLFYGLKAFIHSTREFHWSESNSLFSGEPMSQIKTRGPTFNSWMNEYKYAIPLKK